MPSISKTKPKTWNRPKPKPGIPSNPGKPRPKPDRPEGGKPSWPGKPGPGKPGPKPLPWPKPEGPEGGKPSPKPLPWPKPEGPEGGKPGPRPLPWPQPDKPWDIPDKKFPPDKLELPDWKDKITDKIDITSDHKIKDKVRDGFESNVGALQDAFANW